MSDLSNPCGQNLTRLLSAKIGIHKIREEGRRILNIGHNYRDTN